MQMINKEPSVKTPHLKLGYDSVGRFTSYWHQIKEVSNGIDSKGKILEVGVGNRFVADYLIKYGFTVKTLDIREENQPDYIGSVTNIPLADQSFDVVACFQVLEHLPFETFTQGLREMARVARQKVLFSLPDLRYVLEVNLALLSPHRSLHKQISFPRFIRYPRLGDGHLWEIGQRGYPLNKILGSLPPSLLLERFYRVPGNPYHQMFVCQVCPEPLR
jgi:Methyltransferase domain